MERIIVNYTYKKQPFTIELEEACPPVTPEDWDAYQGRVLFTLLAQEQGSKAKDFIFVSFRIAQEILPTKEAIWRKRWKQSRMEQNFDKAEEHRAMRESRQKHDNLIHNPSVRYGMNHAFPCHRGTSTP